MRSLSIFALLVSAASFASAATMTIACSQNVYSGQNGSGQSSTCGAAALPLGSIVTAISYDYAIDFNFNNFAAQPYFITAALDGNGAADASGLLVNTSNRPLVGSVTVANADWAAFLAGASIGTSYVGSTSAITGATFDTQVNITYDSAVPEPSTFALVGGIMVLAGIRKFRK